jgi:putative membrane-bound dehydrogenase-like protein
MLPRRVLAAGALLSLLVFVLEAGTRTAADTDGPPYPPADSMKTMQIDPGFRLELVASEPDIQSPVALDIDEDGRMFVVEMPGYPLDVSPTGTVRLLEDRDGDGRFEHVTVFADGLVLPTGVMRWRKGILVTAAPDVLYFEDTDGDGRADVRRVVLTGFARSNPQHTVNSPVYGLDNWVYVAHQGAATAIIYKDLFGDRGRPLTFPASPDTPPVDPGDSTVRFRPDTFQAEPIAGESQYGHTFDAYGRYFGNDNSHHLWHEVIAARYLQRNPQLLVREVMHDVPDHGAAAQVFPITKRPTFELLTEAGEFTSACAPTMYLGGAFGGDYEGSVFVAEPVHNLVHRDVLSQAGPTFTARRGNPDREFLAAGDAWFRPVNFYLGPDAALYVVDYYRARIEHPEWTASDTQRDPSSMYAGQDRGRIYRVIRNPAGTEVPAPRPLEVPAPPPSEVPAPRPSDVLAPYGGQPRRHPALGTASSDELVAALSDGNLWWRRTAQRLLVARNDRAAVPALTTLASAGATALGRLHALWTLDGLGALDGHVIARALNDPDPGVRETAVRLAELHGSVPGLDGRLAALTADPDPRVRFQVLATLGGIDTRPATEAHERLLLRGLENSWMQIAGLSAGSGRAAGYFARVTGGSERITKTESPGRALFIRRVTSVIAARQRASEIETVVSTVAEPAGDASGPPCSDAARGTTDACTDAWWRAAALQGLADGSRGRASARVSLEISRGRLLGLAASPSASIRTGALDLLAITGVGEDAAARESLSRAEHVARTGTADPGSRGDAIGLLALDAATDRTALFQSLVDPHEPELVQVAAVRALGRRSGKGIGTLLIDRWARFTPAVRAEAANTLLADEARSWLLIEAIEAGRVQPWNLDFHQKRRLIMNRNDAIRAAARALLEDDPRQRGRLVQRYAAALDMAGDANRGAQVFDRVCVVCHAMAGKGGDLGPDLATVRHRPPLLLLGDILLPSQSIAQKYETYFVERISGGTESGVLAGQTPTSITLRQGSAQQVTIPRAEIRTMTVSPQSSMPADLDKLVSPEDMADLLAFLRRE